MAKKSQKSPKKAARKPAPKKAAKKPSDKSAKKTAKKKPVSKKAPAKKKPAAAKGAKTKKPVKPSRPSIFVHATPPKPRKLTGFLAKQRTRLLALKDILLDSMSGVAKDSLRSRAEGSEASAFGMHQADAGSDAYDRDFALSLLSQEQDSLYEIDEALKRIESGSYGVCENCGKHIPHPRLEALPFTRYTVDCQADLEKHNRFSRVRQPVASLFGLSEEEGGEGEEEESSNENKE